MLAAGDPPGGRAGDGRPAAPQVVRTPHIGYVYPAGGKQGETFQVTVGGQFLDGVNEAIVSGGGRQGHGGPVRQADAAAAGQRLRDTLQELQTKRAAAMGCPRRSARRQPPPRPARRSGGHTNGARRHAHGAGRQAHVDAGRCGHAGQRRKELATFVRRPTSQAIAEIVTLQVTVAADAEPGRRELRLGTPAGVTNPLVFCVGQLPEFRAAGGRSTRAETPTPEARPAARWPSRCRSRPTARSWPAAWTGSASRPARASGWSLPPAPGDCALPGRRRPRLVPGRPGALRLKGNEVAYADDFRFNPDPVIFYQVPRDGEYVLEIKDSIYRGREDFVYRISMGELPFVTGIFPLGGPAGAAATVEVRGWNLPATKLTMDAKDKAPGVYRDLGGEGRRGLQPRAVRGRRAAGMPGEGAQRRPGDGPGGRAADHRQRADRSRRATWTCSASTAAPATRSWPRSPRGG